MDFAPNLLQRDFSASAPNQKWVTDTKAAATTEGWLYLAVILDLFSRMVVGWALGAKEDGALVELAPCMALAQRCLLAGLVHHSDRGSEYSCERYQAVLQEADFQVSMSRRRGREASPATRWFITRTDGCDAASRITGRNKH